MSEVKITTDPKEITVYRLFNLDRVVTRTAYLVGYLNRPPIPVFAISTGVKIDTDYWFLSEEDARSDFIKHETAIINRIKAIEEILRNASRDFEFVFRDIDIYLIRAKGCRYSFEINLDFLLNKSENVEN